MMDQALTDALRVSTDEVLTELCDAARVRAFIDSGKAYDDQLWGRITELGWPMLAVPEEYGGLGGGVAQAALVQEAMGAAVAPLPFLTTCIFSEALAAWPDPTLQERLLPAIAAGEIVAGVDQLMSTHLRLAEAGDHYTLSGTQAGVLDGLEADWLLLTVVGANDERGVLILPTDSEGVSVRRQDTADWTRTLAVVVCKDVKVEKQQVLLGLRGGQLIQRLGERAALLVACDAIGGASRIFDMTMDYLKVRTQFGKPIGSFQALKHRAADLKTALGIAQGIVLAAIENIAAGQPGAWAAMAKAQACSVYDAIAADAVQMHGGIGFTWEHPAHLYLKRAALDEALFGGVAVQLDRIAECLPVGEN